MNAPRSYEIEKKYKLEIDGFVSILNAFDAVFLSESHQIDSYYAMNLHVSGARHYIRIRQDLTKNKGSFDHHIVLSKTTAEEKELPLSLDQAMAMRDSFLILGIKPLCVVDKNRKVFSIGDFVKIMIDDVKNLGFFVELECMSNDSLNPEIERVLENLATKLGLKPEHLVEGKGYPDMIMDLI